MPKPDALNRDFPQVLKESYDPSIERIRIDALVTDGIDAMIVNEDGSINTRNAATLVTKPFDYFSAQYPSATTEVYQFYLGGPSGTLQQTVTLTYTDSTKNFLLSGSVS